MLIFYFVLMPRLRYMDTRKPMLWGLIGLIISQVLLIIVSSGDYLLLIVSTVIEAFSTPAATTLLDKLTVVTVDAKERARIMAMMYVAVIVITSPFGWIAGLLSQANRSLPFILNIILFTVSAILVYITIRRVKPGETVTA